MTINLTNVEPLTCLDCNTPVNRFAARYLCRRCYRTRWKAGTLAERPMMGPPARPARQAPRGSREVFVLPGPAASTPACRPVVRVGFDLRLTGAHLALLDADQQRAVFEGAGRLAAALHGRQEVAR